MVEHGEIKVVIDLVDALDMVAKLDALSRAVAEVVEKGVDEGRIALLAAKLSALRDSMIELTTLEDEPNLF